MAIIEEHKDDVGRLHCEDGPAVVKETPNGNETEWYQHGIKHRVREPAIESPNYTEYWNEGKLHRDGGPSVIYHKGDKNGVGIEQKLWHLNGVKVTKQIAESKIKDFNRKWFLKEENTEVRREIIRKFGIESIFKITKKKENELKIGEAFILNTKDDYELWRGRLTDETYGTYLKMKNPSIGVWHLEGVISECKTVKDALEWRNHGLKKNPETLT